MTTFHMTLPFDTDSAEFVRGVEVGLMYARLQVEPLPIVALAHVENAEMCMRLAEAAGCTAQAQDVGGGWVEVVFR
jgi:hypothetical protein